MVVDVGRAEHGLHNTDVWLVLRSSLSSNDGAGCWSCVAYIRLLTEEDMQGHSEPFEGVGLIEFRDI